MFALLAVTAALTLPGAGSAARPPDPLAVLGAPTKVMIGGKPRSFYLRRHAGYLLLCEIWLYNTPAGKPLGSIERCRVLGLIHAKKATPKPKPKPGPVA
jgi:hypothetical protein